MQQHQSQIVAVVVSAWGKTSQKIQNAVGFAAEGKEKEMAYELDALKVQSLNMYAEVLAILGVRGELQNSSLAEEWITPFLKPLRELLFGISLLQEQTEAAMDTALSFGERLSAMMMTVKKIFVLCV